VSTVTEAVASALAGAGLVDVGENDALILQIRDAVPEVGICGHGAGADIVHDAALAARAGADLICRDPGTAAGAVQRGIKPERILLQTAPDDVRAASRSGWAALVDLDPGTLADLDPGTLADLDPGTLADLDPGTLADLDPGTLVDLDPGTLADLDPGTLVGLDQGTESLARAEAVAAVCAWTGAKVIRTRHVAEIRRCLDMTESILGLRRPAWTLRGLA
jgi:dihydropteroate synthase